MRFPSRDRLLSATLRYGLLILYAAIVYAIVVALGVSPTVENTEVPWWLHLIAIAMIAGTILPVHNWLRVSIDRLVYDWNENPYAVLSELGHHLDLEQDQSLQAIVSTIAGTIAATLQLPYVAVETDLDSGVEVVSFGEAPPGAEELAIPLVYHGTRIGALYATARRPNESLSDSDRRVLSDLARQVTRSTPQTCRTTTTRGTRHPVLRRTHSG